MNSSRHKPGAARRRILLSALVAGAASCAAWLLLNRGSAPKTAVKIAPPARRVESAATPLRTPHSELPTPSAAASRVEPAAPPHATGTVVPLPEPTAYGRQLVATLCTLDQSAIPQSADQMAQWKQNLQQLIAQGPSAVAAIREFLQKNVDLDFGLGNGLGYASARSAMFDALVQIGGAEGIAGTLQTLQNTADPREIALLGSKPRETRPGRTSAGSD